MVARILGIASLVAAVSVPFAAHADWPRDGIELGSVVELYTLNVLRDTDGRFLATYYSSQTEATHGAVMSPDGVQLWTQELAVPGTPASDGQGGMFMLQSSGNVFLKRLDVDQVYHPGPTHWNTWQLNAIGTSAYAPVILSDAEQGAFIAWAQGGGAELRMRRMDSNGASKPGWPDAGRVVWTHPSSSSALELDGTGGIYVAGTGGWVQHLLGDGSTAPGWPEGGISVTQNGAMNVRLVRLDASNVAVIWQAAGTWRVQKVKSDGTLYPTWPVAGVPIYCTGFGDIVPDGAGGLWLAGYGTSWRMYHVLDDGTTPFQIPAGFGFSPYDAGAVSQDLAIGTGRDGGVVAAWADTRQSTRTARIRTFDANGAPVYWEHPVARKISALYEPARVNALYPEGDHAYVVTTSIPQPNSVNHVLVHKVPAQLPSVGVDDGRAEALQLAPPWPNPARGEFSVRFVLDRDAAAGLELFDVSGRLVRWRTVSGAGEHLERFDRLDTLDPGLYFLRLSLDGETRVARVVLSQ